jgi:hypothetical protein
LKANVSLQVLKSARRIAQLSPVNLISAGEKHGRNFKLDGPHGQHRFKTCKLCDGQVSRFRTIERLLQLSSLVSGGG